MESLVLSADQFILLMDKLDILIDLGSNMIDGIHFIMMIVSAFFVWKVVQILYKLFGGVFFGGV